MGGGRVDALEGGSGREEVNAVRRCAVLRRALEKPTVRIEH